MNEDFRKKLFERERGAVFKRMSIDRIVVFNKNLPNMSDNYHIEDVPTLHHLLKNIQAKRGCCAALELLHGDKEGTRTVLWTRDEGWYTPHYDHMDTTYLLMELYITLPEGIKKTGNAVIIATF